LDGTIVAFVVVFSIIVVSTSSFSFMNTQIISSVIDDALAIFFVFVLHCVFSHLVSKPGQVLAHFFELHVNNGQLVLPS
jgi:hypothetical protein